MSKVTFPRKARAYWDEDDCGKDVLALEELGEGEAITAVDSHMVDRFGGTWFAEYRLVRMVRLRRVETVTVEIEEIQEAADGPDFGVEVVGE